MGERRFIIWRDSDRRVAVLAGLLAIILGVLVSLLFVVFTTIRIVGPSMEPALYEEDRVLITKTYEVPRRGDIVSALVPDEHGRGVRVMKRVVALEGDTIKVHGDVAYVNGERVAGGTVSADAVVWNDEIVVPEGHVYLLGDNRPLSYDSRMVGPVPLDRVRGRVVAIIAPIHRFSIID